MLKTHLFYSFLDNTIKLGVVVFHSIIMVWKFLLGIVELWVFNLSVVLKYFKQLFSHKPLHRVLKEFYRNVHSSATAHNIGARVKNRKKNKKNFFSLMNHCKDFSKIYVSCDPLRKSSNRSAALQQNRKIEL